MLLHDTTWRSQVCEPSTRFFSWVDWRVSVNTDLLFMKDQRGHYRAALYILSPSKQKMEKFYQTYT